MPLCQLSLNDIPTNALLLRFKQNNFYCVDANELSCKELGVDKKELLKMSIVDIFPSAKENGFYDALTEVNQGTNALTIDISSQALNRKNYLHCNNLTKIKNGDIMTLFNNMQQYKDLENKYETIQQLAHIGHWKWDILEDVITWSDEVYRIFGEKPQSFQPTFANFLSYLNKEDQEKLQMLVKTSMQTKEPYTIEHEVIHKDGTKLYVRGSGSVEFDENNRPVSLMGSVFDISQTRESLLALQQSEEKFRIISEVSLMGIFIYKEHYLYANDAFCKMTGYSLQEIYKLHPWDFILQPSPEIIKSIAERRLKGEEFPQKYNDLVVVDKDGSEKSVRVMTQTIFYEGSYAGLGTIMDITDIQNAKKELELLATTDNLTSIANRHMMHKSLDTNIERFKRYKDGFILLMIDIDYFKRVNDNYGHDIGDYVLQEIVHLISKEIRDGDIFARWGGEEFLLLLPKLSQNEALKVTDKLRLLIKNHSFKRVSSLTISIGATDITSLDTKQTLLKRVDDAMYAAKHNGRDCVVFQKGTEDE